MNQNKKAQNTDTAGHTQHDQSHLVDEKHATPAVELKSGITIYIDNTPYHAQTDTFSGAELRNLPMPPIGLEKNIFQVVSGKGDDVQLADTDVIAVNKRKPGHGRYFFSDTIVPAKDAVARRAYYIYLEEGSKPGNDAANWAKAEAQLDPRPKA